MRRFAGVAAVLSGLGASPGLAQEPDSNVVWLWSETVTFLVRADTALGVELMVSAQVVRNFSGAEPKSFLGRYRPDDLVSWVGEADLLLLPDRPAAGDAPTLSTTPLGDIRGGKSLAARLRKGDRWSRQVVLSFRPVNQESLTFEVSEKRAKALFEALGRMARRSSMSRPGLAFVLDHCRIPHPTGVMIQGPTRVSGPRPIYPESLRDRGLSGMVLVKARVDSTGILSSVQAVFSTHPALIQAGESAVRGSTYRPAISNGRPVTVEICQPVNFSVRR